MIKIGTEPGLENIPLRIKEFHPQARIFGVTSHPGQPHNFDEVITTSSDAMLSAHDEYLARGLFVRPELFEQIRKVEGQLIRIADRVLLHDLTTITHPQFPIPKFRGSIDDRSQLVLRQVAYWDFIIDSKEINAIVFQNYGHIGWDVALQNVASARGIPFLFFHEVRPFLGRLFVHDSIEGIGDFSLGAELIKSAQSSGNWIACPSTELDQMRNQIGLNADKNENETPPPLAKRFSRLLNRFRRPRSIPYRIKKSISRRIQVQISLIDEKRSITPSPLPKDFLFCELQSQPNATTSIKGWMFADQRESVAFVAHHLPEDWALVVKESDRQWTRLFPRRRNFWSQIASIPKVHVVSSTSNSKELVDRAKGLVETSYSTLALRAVHKGVPLIVFGHTHIGSIPNVWVVRTSADLVRAIDSITGSDLMIRPSLEIRKDLENFARDVQAATICGALSSTPSTDDRAALIRHQSAVTTNVAGVISAWLKTI